MRTLRAAVLGVFCLLLLGCSPMVAQHQGPWPWDMFSVYNGMPSTPEQRQAATNDCLSYSSSVRSQTPTILWYQICMLSLGFRAPQGELFGVAGDPISGGGCMYTPYHPVCWAEKNGWPQDPPLRWFRPGTSRWDLEGDISICLERTPGMNYQNFTPYMDKCMVSKGYAVVHPSSPSMVWPARNTWPNCAKPDSGRSWIEKKWCPRDSSGAPVSPNPVPREKTTTQPHASLS